MSSFTLVYCAPGEATGADPGFWSGGPSGVLSAEGGGGLSPKFAQNRGFSLKIMWKLYDFEQKSWGHGGPWPPGPPGSACVLQPWKKDRKQGPRKHTDSRNPNCPMAPRCNFLSLHFVHNFAHHRLKTLLVVIPQSRNLSSCGLFTLAQTFCQTQSNLAFRVSSTEEISFSFRPKMNVSFLMFL